MEELETVLTDDGILKIDTHGSINKITTRLDEIKKRMGDPPWSVRIVLNEYISAVLIAQNVGEGNRWHYHSDCDEFWVILEGSLMWIIDGVGEIIGEETDIIFVPRNVKHKMVTIGNKPSIRVSVSTPNVKHIFADKNEL